MKAQARNLISFLICVALVSQGYSAESASATAEVIISLRIPDIITISGLDPIQMRWQPGKGAYYGKDRLCVHRHESETYSVVASSWNGGSDTFLLRRGASLVPYSVAWNGRKLHAGNPVDIRSSMDEHQTACSEQGNTKVEVTATPEQARGALEPGMHTDVLLLGVRAE